MTAGDIQKAIFATVLLIAALVLSVGCQNSHYYPPEERMLIFLEQFEVKEEATFTAIHRRTGKEATVTLPVGSVVSVQAKEEKPGEAKESVFSGKVAYTVGGK